MSQDYCNCSFQAPELRDPSHSCFLSGRDYGSVTMRTCVANFIRAYIQVNGEPIEPYKSLADSIESNSFDEWLKARSGG